MNRIIRKRVLTTEEVMKNKTIRDQIAAEFPKRIEIQFPEHVQAWTVTPHGGELANTARRMSETGQGVKSPVLPSDVILQPRADRDGLAPEQQPPV